MYVFIFFMSYLSLFLSLFEYLFAHSLQKIREIALESFFGENGLEQLLPVFNAIDDASFLFQSLGLPSSLRVRLVLQICENLQSILFNQLLASPDYRNPDFVAYLSNSISLTMDWAVRILERMLIGPVSLSFFPVF